MDFQQDVDDKKSSLSGNIFKFKPCFEQIHLVKKLPVMEG